MTWYNPFTWFAPSVKLTPQPIELNPSKLRAKERAVMRHERVCAAIAKGDGRPELVAEEKKLRQFIEWVS